jgi:excisionase family DNA binding protein
MDELLTLDEVAARFRVSRRTMQEHVKRYPFYRTLGRRKLFTEADVNHLYEVLECPSNSSNGMVAGSGTSSAPSAASLWTRAQALLTEPRQKKCARSASGRSSRRAFMAEKQLPHS